MPDVEVDFNFAPRNEQLGPEASESPVDIHSLSEQLTYHEHEREIVVVHPRRVLAGILS